MAEKKTVYVARDGSQHEYKQEAESHEELLDLMEYVDLNPMYGDQHSKIDGQQFALWLRDNPRVYVKLIPSDIPMAGDAHADG